METIKSGEDISCLFSEGKRQSTPYFTLIYRKQHGPGGRVAFIAGKKLGNAVWRSAAKRRMREVCRACGGPWPCSDVIFLAKSAVTRADYSKVLTACAKALERADLQIEGICRG